MAFDFTNEKGNIVSIEQAPEELIVMRFEDTPVSWYNGANKEANTIQSVTRISYPKLMELRRSPEFKASVEAFLLNNGHSETDKNLEQAGVLGEKRTINRHHPDAKKITVWGNIVEETDTRIVIEKLPVLENEFAGKNKSDLIKMVMAAREAAASSEVPEDELSEAMDAMDAEVEGE